MDYDQPSTDAAEFLEIKNVSGEAIDLSSYSVELVNGTGGGATVYQTITLPTVSLAAGDYFVVCANLATVANCDLDVAPDTNLIQDGPPTPWPSSRDPPSSIPCRTRASGEHRQRHRHHR